MKKTVVLNFKNGKTLPVEAKKMEVNTNQAMLPTNSIELPLFIEVSHQGLTTLLNLSHQPDCMVLQFKKVGRFSGATICKNRNEGSFMIQSQASKPVFCVKCLRYPRLLSSFIQCDFC